MSQQQYIQQQKEIEQYENNDTTNYLNEEKMQQFLWGLERLYPFHSDTGRPPMSAQQFMYASTLQYNCGFRITELLNLIKDDLNLDRRIVKVRDPKTAKGNFQKTTVIPRDIDWLQKYLEPLEPHDRLFPAGRMIMWRYYKDAGALSGLNIFESNKLREIEGVWTHLMRKSCSKRMQELGASRELRMLKLRHTWKDAHDAYDAPDINTLLKWEEVYLS